MFWIFSRHMAFECSFSCVLVRRMSQVSAILSSARCGEEPSGSLAPFHVAKVDVLSSANIESRTSHGAGTRRHLTSGQHRLRTSTATDSRTYEQRSLRTATHTSSGIYVFLLLPESFNCVFSRQTTARALPAGTLIIPPAAC